VLFGIAAEYFRKVSAIGWTKGVYDMLANFYGTLFGVTFCEMCLKINIFF